MAKRNQNRVDLFQQITDQYVEAFEQGAASPNDWVPPWGMTGVHALPYNVETGKMYKGMNLLMLYTTGHRFWAGYGQWKELGAQVRKGEKGTPILVRSTGIKKNSDGTPKLNKDGSPDGYVYFRTVSVFHSEQVDGWSAPTPKETTTIERNAAVDALVASRGAVINYGGDSACYIPSADTINMPMDEQFHTVEDFYGTLLHEVGHWAVNHRRLDINIRNEYNGNGYAFEELIVELASAFVCTEMGVHGGMRDDHMKYLTHWANVLRQDKTAISTAARHASRVAQYILTGVDIDKEDNVEDTKMAA